MPDVASARELAGRMRGIGVRAGRPTVCELTAMDSPLGAAVGNALEVAEACEMLAGRGAGRLPRARARLGRAHGGAVRSRRRLLRGRAPPGRGARSPPARRCARWSGWSRPRVATRGSPSGRGTCWSGAGRRRGARAARGLGRALRRARHRPCRDAARRRPRAQGGSDRPRRRHRRALRSRATRSRPASRSRMCTRGTPQAPSAPWPRCSRRSRSSTARSSARRCCSRRSAEHARAPRGRDGPTRAGAAPERADARRGRDPRLPADRARAARGGRRAARGARIETLDRRGKYLLDRAGRRRRAARAPAHDRQPALARGAARRRASLPARPRAARRRLLPRLHRRSPLRHVARRRGRRRGLAGGQARARAAGRLGGRRAGRALAGRKAPVKAALLDQRVVAGVGNIYADEALFAAKIHPASPAGRLSRARVARLHAAVRRRTQAGIEAQGASIRDFRTPDGGYGSAQERFAAYGRGGEPCERLRHAVAAHGHRAARDVVLPALSAVLGSPGSEQLGQLAARVERAQLAEPADRLRRRSRSAARCSRR